MDVAGFGALDAKLEWLPFFVLLDFVELHFRLLSFHSLDTNIAALTGNSQARGGPRQAH